MEGGVAAGGAGEMSGTGGTSGTSGMSGAGGGGGADGAGGAAKLRVSRSCAIPLDELTWRFTGSGGPGGQHANTANTKVEVRFDVLGSPSLGPRQRQRLLDRLGPTVRVVASDERSQARNRELALDRLRKRLADALRHEAVRIPTGPTVASRRRRLEDKRRQAERKQARRRPAAGEE